MSHGVQQEFHAQHEPLLDVPCAPFILPFEGSEEFGGGARVAEQLPNLFDASLESMLENGEEQLVLVGEVAVKGATRQAGSFGDLLDGRAVEALASEHGGGGVEDPLARGLLTLGPGHS